MTARKILVAQPVGRLGIDARCNASMVATIVEGGRRGHDIAYAPYYRDTIAVARASLATDALEQGRDLLFWDSDIEAPPDRVLAMVEREGEWLGVNYRQHVDDDAALWAAPVDLQQPAVDGVISATKGLPLGLTVIRHSALRRLAHAYASLSFVLRGRQVIGCFREDAHPTTGWWRFEDIAFFVRAHGVGLRPLMVLDCPTVHHGSVAVAGNLVDEHRRTRPEAA